ncbi:anti-repressor SinI family protein [Alkalihalobacillus pseudalcaliphilus]|nr:anti-repressor SinI family protein [Alkalihalobacillus pseudalcaliphilus]
MRKEGLDVEWLSLISEAKRLGLTLEEVRDYINNSKKRPTEDSFNISNIS